jgi:23S rRNA pseudouridine1911/1915/1917 synthase
MHSVPLKNGGDTLLDWYAGIFPPVMDMCGRKEGEGGLLHRLDFETQGLVLFAKI